MSKRKELMIWATCWFALSFLMAIPSSYIKSEMAKSLGYYPHGVNFFGVFGFLSMGMGLILLIFACSEKIKK